MSPLLKFRNERSLGSGSRLSGSQTRCLVSVIPFCCGRTRTIHCPDELTTVTTHWATKDRIRDAMSCGILCLRDRWTKQICVRGLWEREMSRGKSWGSASCGVRRPRPTANHSQALPATPVQGFSLRHPYLNGRGLHQKKGNLHQ